MVSVDVKLHVYLLMCGELPLRLRQDVESCTVCTSLPLFHTSSPARPFHLVSLTSLTSTNNFQNNNTQPPPALRVYGEMLVLK